MKITAAAIKLKSGTHTGPSHGRILLDLAKAGETEHVFQPCQGFVDDSGTFLTRSQVYEVAEAAGQLKLNRMNKVLLSENVNYAKV